nr:uncharacterized protein LOC108945554 isoform X2 [Nicotiana tomentosiformis]
MLKGGCVHSIFGQTRKKTWRGETRRKAFWRCAKASFEPQERRRTTTEVIPNSQPATQQSSNTTEAMPMRLPSIRHSSVSSSLCQDTTRVRNNISTGRGRERGLGIGVGRGKGRGTGIEKGKGAGYDSTSTTVSAPTGFAIVASFHAATKSVYVVVGKKRTRELGFGIYTDTQSGRQVLNPETLNERVISSGRQLKNASLTNIDLGFKPSRLKWEGKAAITENQLQQQKEMQMKKKKAH